MALSRLVCFVFAFHCLQVTHSLVPSLLAWIVQLEIDLIKGPHIGCSTPKKATRSHTATHAQLQSICTNLTFTPAL